MATVITCIQLRIAPPLLIADFHAVDRPGRSHRPGGQERDPDVEFARQREAGGADLMDAVREACRLRLRPVLMTSLAFIMGRCRSPLPLAPVRRCGRRWVSRSSLECWA